jgi:hypothetical protein
MSELHKRLFRDEETFMTTILVGCVGLSVVAFLVVQVAVFCLR